MRVITAQEFVNLIANTLPTSYAVAQHDSHLKRDLLIISTRVTPQIKVIYRKAFNLLPDGTVFFDVHPLEEGAWLIDADLIVQHENKTLFDSTVSRNATELFEIVKLNVDPGIFSYYTEAHNEIRVAQTLLPVQKVEDRQLQTVGN